MKKKVISIIIILLVFIGIHITPNIALRTYVFIIGHPVVALTTTIEDDPIHKDLQTQNTRFYILNPAPLSRETRNDMTSYKVTKIGFLYFAQYYGEG